jgi:hypothetical protein|tara:strand:- start:87 stop:389 length:303 start_codon:yes stop_codon:yes gene_type:complete
VLVVLVFRSQLLDHQPVHRLAHQVHLEMDGLLAEAVVVDSQIQELEQLAALVVVAILVILQVLHRLFPARTDFPEISARVVEAVVPQEMDLKVEVVALVS